MFNHEAQVPFDITGSFRGPSDDDRIDISGMNE